VDDRKTSISLHDLVGRVGAVAASGVRRAADVDDKHVGFVPEQVEQLPPDPLREGSVAYCGDAQQVSEGFAIALRAMGVESSILLGHVGLPTTNQNREDDWCVSCFGLWFRFFVAHE
jgi:hypothetical protein